MSRRYLLAIASLGAVLAFSLVQAQDQPQGGGRRRGGGQPGAAADAGGRRGGPAQMRERQMTNIKEQLGATEDEWKALSPKIEKILTLQGDLRPPFRPFGRTRPPEAAAQPQSKVVEAQADLSKALEDKSTSADDVAKKLAAYREARDNARTELTAAQKELKTTVKGRQEAVLVINGVID